jgi:hypothetical protein
MFEFAVDPGSSCGSLSTTCGGSTLMDIEFGTDIISVGGFTFMLAMKC